MNILIVASEAAPFLRTSGVADVVIELAMQLRREGHDVRLIVPRYRSMIFNRDPDTILDRLDVPLGSSKARARVLRVDHRIDGDQILPLYLVSDEVYFDRESAYGYVDDFERFIFFTRAALEMLRHPEFAQQEWLPEVIHAHDWVTGLIPMWIRHTYNDDPILGRVAVVYTIHNAGFSGQSNSRSIHLAELSELGVYESFGETSQTISFMARGIFAADVVNTVSPRHASELESGAYASDLQKVILSRKDRVSGILNGVDDALYDPSLDSHIPVRFGPAVLSRRRDNKAALQQECALAVDSGVTIFGMVGRLIAEKGVGLLEEVLPELLRTGKAQFVLLGLPGDYRFRESFARMRAEFPRQMTVRFTYDDYMARRILAGTDVIVVPSLSEPCGLQQILAMRYGALPLVRGTGGLADTVGDWKSAPAGNAGQGFVFADFTPGALNAAMHEAIDLHHSNARKWHDLQVWNMKLDFSWSHPVAEYLALYRRSLVVARDTPNAACRLPLVHGTPLVADRNNLLLQAILVANEWATTVSPEQYLSRVAEAGLDLLALEAPHHAVLIWTVDTINPQRLVLAASSPSELTADGQRLFQEHSDRTWSSEYVFRVNTPAVQPGLRAQLGFLDSELAKGRGWKAQLTVPVSSGGSILGRIDAFSQDPEREFKEWEITALTVLANTLGVNLARHQVQARLESILMVDREIAAARTEVGLVDVLLRQTRHMTGAEWVLLRFAEGRIFELEDGKVVERDDRDVPRDISNQFVAFSPMIGSSGSPIATLEAGRSHAFPFSRDHQSALNRLAFQAVGALQAVQRREKDERSRVDQLRELAASLVGGGNFDQLLQRIVTTTAGVLQADAASLYLVNEGENLLEIRAAAGYHNFLLIEKEKVSYGKGEGTTGWLWETGEKFKADSREELLGRTPLKGKYLNLQGGKEAEAFMGFPLKVLSPSDPKPAVIGVLKFENGRRGMGGSGKPFTDEEFLLAEMMANIVAAAVYNAQISGAQFQKLSSDLSQLSSALAGGKDMPDLVKQVVDTMATALGAEASSLYLFNPITSKLEIQAAAGYQERLVQEKANYVPGEGITGWIFEKQQLVCFNSLADLRKHEKWKGKQNEQQHFREPSSFLGLPLLVVDRMDGKLTAIGVLKIEELKPTTGHPEAVFTEQDVRLVRMMANVISTVVYNTQLSVAGLKKLSGYLKELSIELTGGKDLSSLVLDIVETTARVLGAEASSLYLYDDQKNALVIRAATGYQKGLVSQRATYTRDEGITGWIFRHKQSVRANNLGDLRAHPAWKGKQNEGQGGREPDSFLGLPLTVAGADGEIAIGVLKVEQIKPSKGHPGQFFTDEDVALVTMMASVIAAFVFNNYVGTEQLQRFSANLEVLSQALAGGPQMDELVDQVVQTIARVLGADASSLYLFDEATGHLVIEAAAGYQRPLVARRATYEPGKGVTGSIFLDPQPFFRANTLEELRRHPAWAGKQNRDQEGREPRSFLGLPLRVAGRTIGVLKIEDIQKSDSHPEGYFTDQDVVLVTMMANVIATVVSNAREGEAHIGKILRRLGVLSDPKTASAELLREYASKPDRGLVDQMAITIAQYLDGNLSRIESEAQALFEAQNGPERNIALYGRIAERAQDNFARWIFSLYYSILSANPTVSTWLEVRELAEPWLDLRASVDSPEGFGRAALSLIRKFAETATLKTTKQFADPGNSLQCIFLGTGDLFGEKIKGIPVIFLRARSLDQDTRTRLMVALNDRLEGVAVVQLVNWDHRATTDQILQLRQALKTSGRDLVVSKVSDLIGIMAAPHPIEEYRAHVFRQASAPLLFVVEGGVPDHMFFGRKKELELIVQEVLADRACLLIGGRKMGKTSIFKRLARVRLPVEGFTIVYQDIRPVRTESEFRAERIYNWYPVPPSDAPQTFGDLVENPPEKLVILLDEADRLVQSDRANGWRLFDTLRARGLRIVLSGAQHLRAATEDQSGPLYNFGKQIDLGPLTKEAVADLINRPMSLIEVSLENPNAIIARVFQFTNGHPSIVQRVCSRLLERLNQKEEDANEIVRRIKLSDVEAVLANAQFQKRDFLYVFWERATCLEIIVSLLMARNPELHRLNDIHAAVTDQVGDHITIQQTEAALEDLIRLRSILTYGDSGYEFVVTSYPEIANGVASGDALVSKTAECKKGQVDGEL